MNNLKKDDHDTSQAALAGFYHCCEATRAVNVAVTTFLVSHALSGFDPFVAPQPSFLEESEASWFFVGVLVEVRPTASLLQCIALALTGW